MRNVLDEREVEPRHELAALFGQIGADRLRRLEALDLVAAEAAIAVDGAAAQFFLPESGIHLRQRRLGFLERQDGRHVVEKHGV